MDWAAAAGRTTAYASGSAMGQGDELDGDRYCKALEPRGRRNESEKAEPGQTRA